MHEIGHYRDKEGFKSNWYDKLDDGKFEIWDEFQFTVPLIPDDVKEDIYLMVETYYPSMQPRICNLAIMPTVSYNVYRDNSKTGELIYSGFNYEIVPKPFVLSTKEYSAGETFVIEVDYTWLLNDVRDYTVRVYSKQDMDVLNSRGKTNMLYTDT